MPDHPVKAVIFDLDGTLLDTLADLTDAVNFALQEMGWPARSLADVRRFVGNGVAKLIERAVPPETPPEAAQTCLHIFRARYAAHAMDKTAPYPGVIDLMQKLHRDDWRIAVVSNKFDAAVKNLCAFYFPGLVDVAVGESEHVPKKPDPAMVMQALHDLGVPAQDAVYVGDSEVDLQTAQNAGLPCISVTWGFRHAVFLHNHHATTLADNPAELLQHLEAFRNS